MDLDITFDSRSTLGVPTDPAATLNAHTAAFDLDTVYGLGPFVNAQYYDVNDNAKLRIESGGIFEDLPRNADMTAIIPDPRTDQHMMLSGLHCAFILFHNKVVDYGRTGRVRLTTVTKETFVPGFLERDEGEREKPCEQYPWDGVSGVRPFRGFAATTTVGVY